MPSDLDFAGPLREALHAADFTYDRVAEAIAEEAHRALGRNETLPALRRTTSGAPLEGALLDPGLELWDSDRRRLTLPLDPARIKRVLERAREQRSPEVSELIGAVPMYWVYRSS